MPEDQPYGNLQLWNIITTAYTATNLTKPIGQAPHLIYGLWGSPSYPWGSTYSDSPGSRLIADAMKYHCPDCDFALINGGSSRGNVPQGFITLASLFHLYPFTDTVVTCRVKGDNIRNALENGVSLGQNNGRFPHGAGLKYAWNNITREILEIKIAQGYDPLNPLQSITYIPLNANAYYKIATFGFMIAGGAGYTMLQGSDDITPGPVIITVLATFIQIQKNLSYPTLEELQNCSFDPLPISSKGLCVIITSDETKFSYERRCPVGQAFQKSTSTCVACPMGRFSSATNSPCLDCSPGRYTNSSQTETCALCPLGRSQQFSSGTTCEACASRYYTQVNGSTYCSLCPEQSIENQNKDGCLCLPNYASEVVYNYVASELEAQLKFLQNTADNPSKVAFLTNMTLKCGINPENRLFATFDPKSQTYHGMQVDICRSLAAAIFTPLQPDVLQRQPNLKLFDQYIQFVEVTENDHLVALVNGRIDVLFTAEKRSSREGVLGLSFSPPFLYSSRVIAVLNASMTMEQLDQVSMKYCIVDEPIVVQTAKMTFSRASPFVGISASESLATFNFSDCDALIIDEYYLSALDYFKVLTDFDRVSYSIATRTGDIRLTEVARWIADGLVMAERDGIASNFSAFQLTQDSLLSHAFGLPISDNALFSSIRCVGNYGEIYRRNFGDRDRNLNRLWNGTEGAFVPKVWNNELNDTSPLWKIVRSRSANRGTILERVKQRKVLRCGIQGNHKVYGFPSGNTYEGLDPDLCRAIAAFIFGETSKDSRISYYITTLPTRWQDLYDQKIDVLIFSTTVTLGRDAQLGLDFSPPYMYESFGLLRLKSADDICRSPICTPQSTTNVRSINKYCPNASVFPIDTLEHGVDLLGTSCFAVASDYSLLSPLLGLRPNLGLRAFPDFEPIAVAMLDIDPDFSKIVSWAMEALLLAEYYNLTQDTDLSAFPPEALQLTKPNGLPINGSGLAVLRTTGNMKQIRSRWNVSTQILLYPSVWDDEKPLSADIKCTRCPDGANCTEYGMNSNDLLAANGWWKTGNPNLPFISCINDACVGGIQICAAGYHGPLCTVCTTPEYGRTGNFNCSPCLPYSVNLFVLVLVIILIFLFVGVYTTFVYETSLPMKPQKVSQDRIRDSTFVTIFITTIQSNAIAASFDFEWSPRIRAYFSGQSVLLDWRSGSFSFECALTDSFFTFTVGMFFLPIILCIFALFFLVIYLRQEKKRIDATPRAVSRTASERFELDENCNPAEAYYKIKSFPKKKIEDSSLCERVRKVWYAVTVISLFFVYPALCKQCFQLFNCKDIASSDGPVLYNDMKITCWKGQHRIYVLALGIPMLILYVIGIPVFMAITLVFRTPGPKPKSSNEHKLRDWENAVYYYWRRYAFLFEGLKYKYRYWQIVVTLRKTMLIAVAVFAHSDVRTQSFLGILLLTGAIILQLFFQPFSDPDLNHFEMFSLLSTYSVFLFGVVYVEQDYSLEFREGFSVVPILANVSFVIFGVVYFGRMIWIRRKEFCVKPPPSTQFTLEIVGLEDESEEESVQDTEGVVKLHMDSRVKTS